jgi:hypothetical protein
MTCSSATADLVGMLEEVGRILVHTIGTGALELFAAIPSGQETDPQGAGAASGQHVSDAVADDGGRLDADAVDGKWCVVVPLRQGR